MGEINEADTRFAPFLLHEVSFEERNRFVSASPSHSILKTPTVSFPNSESGEAPRSARRLTFADGSEEMQEGSRESTPKKQTNGGSDSHTAMVEVAISPVSSMKVSPEAWKAHQAYRRFQDYPNETVKTDYTYSWLSPFHRREIVPGIPMRPNMSRPPLRNPSFSEPAIRTATPLRSRIYTSYKPYSSTFVKSMSGRFRGLQRSYEADQFSKRWFWLLLLLIFSGFLVWQLLGGPTIIQEEVPNDSNVTALLRSVTLRLVAIESAIADELKYRKTVEALYFDAEKILQMTVLTNHQQCCQHARRQALRSFHESHQQNLKDAEEKQILVENQLSHLRTLVEERIFQLRRNVSSALGRLRDEIIYDNFSTHTVHQIVNQRLKLYDSDKTALPDYALESAGGRILSIRCTQPWPGSEGISFDPRSAIRKGLVPGECWAFQGTGHLVIQLAYPIIVTACSVEHIPSSIHPLGRTKSAPQRFALWGLREENDSHPHVFGNYTYEIGPDVDTVQRFPVVHASEEHFQFVEFVVLSNHGYNYTCLYRVRIHGTLT